MFANSCAHRNIKLIWTEFIDVLKNKDTFYFTEFPFW
jgi:hypothetical protein